MTYGTVQAYYSIYVIEIYEDKFAASALAGNNFARYMFAAAFPLFTPSMINRLGHEWAVSLFGFLAVLLLPVPWLLFLWGPLLRSKSRFIKSRLANNDV